ncbi:MAG: mechanosensitive ion channel family protein [Candidatus Saliniplasma sp.]
MEIAGYGLQEELPYLGLSLWNLILFVITLVVGLILVKVVSRMIKNAMLRNNIRKILTEFTTRILRIVLYVFVIGVSLSFLGVQVGAALISLSVVLGFVLGFALGDTLSNIASGVMIAITKPFRSGHYVKVNGEEGVIKSVGISLTELDTKDNKHIVIPNKLVWGSNIVNYTHNKTRRVDIETGVGYDDDLDLAIKTSLNILKTHPKVLDEPEPQVKVKSMDDSFVGLTVRPWVKTEDYWNTFFDLQKQLKEGYDEAGLNIPYPQMDVHLDK